MIENLWSFTRVEFLFLKWFIKHPKKDLDSKTLNFWERELPSLSNTVVALKNPEIQRVYT